MESNTIKRVVKLFQQNLFTFNPQLNIVRPFTYILRFARILLYLFTYNRTKSL